MNELVPAFSGRPPIVHVEGVTLYLGIHDRAYLDAKAVWKRKLAAVHPDRLQQPRVQTYQQTVNGEVRTITRRQRYRHARAHRFRKVAASYRQWRALEWKWYAAHGLTPPDWTGA